MELKENQAALILEVGEDGGVSALQIVVGRND
jgi:hypothetical protein